MIIECPYDGCDVHNEVQPSNDIYNSLSGAFTYSETTYGGGEEQWEVDYEFDGYTETECDNCGSTIYLRWNLNG